MFLLSGVADDVSWVAWVLAPPSKGAVSIANLEMRLVFSTHRSGPHRFLDVCRLDDWVNVSQCPHKHCRQKHWAPSY